MKKIKNKIEHTIYTIVAIIVIITSFFYYNKSNQEETSTSNETNLEVRMIDVGQAECILIRNEEHNILIDAGNNKDGKLLVEYFKSLNINSFDYVIGTHPHEDHIGGLDNIINNFTIEHIMMPDVTTNTQTFSDVLDAIESKNLEIKVPEIDSTFKVGDLLFTVIYTGTDNNDLNNSSIVLRMDYQNDSYLFTSDITSEVEKNILDKNIDVDIYKVAHHCSTYSNSADFLAKVTPEYAIISVGKDNEYYLPHAKALKRIQKYTDNIYRTDELGTIIIKDDGNNINITNEKTNTNGG